MVLNAVVEVGEELDDEEDDINANAGLVDRSHDNVLPFR
jgi:hypothetical protein